MILANEPYTDQLYLQKSTFVSVYFRLLWYHSILKGSIDQRHAKTNEIWRQNSKIDSPFAWSHWLLLASMISRSFQTVKPGSHMPRSYLRHSCRCCLRHRSDMRTEVAGNRSHVSLYRQHACEVDSNSTSQACRQWRRLRCFLLPATLCPHMSEKYRRQYRRLCRRYFGGIWEAGLRRMREAWKRKHNNVRSQSLSSESAVKYPHVGRGNIPISPSLGEHDQSNAPPKDRQRQSNPHPMATSRIKAGCLFL